MSKIAVCTSFYEVGRPFLGAFIAGLNEASAGQDVMLVAANHGLSDPEASLATVNGTVDIRIEGVPVTASFAEVRERMLMAVAETDAEYLILVDMDDYLLPDGIAAHLVAMQNADFSYGDMMLIDGSGADMGRTFYQACDVPPHLSGRAGLADILKRNFLGFSNTGLRRVCVDLSRLEIPDDLVAVDWWFYTLLLLDGRNGAKTDNPVVCYRTHSANILGSRADTDLASVRRRIAINRRHYEAFSGETIFDGRRAVLDQLSQWVDREDETVALAVDDACATPGLWFDDIARLTERVLAH